MVISAEPKAKVIGYLQQLEAHCRAVTRDGCATEPRDQAGDEEGRDLEQERH